MNDDRIRRHRTRAEERIAGLDVQPSALLDEVEQLRRQLEEARQEAADNRASWQRSAADFANYKRRSEQEREATLGLANEMLLAKLLNVVDDFDRALAAMPPELQHLGWIEGLWLVERKLRALLESEGVTPIEAVGKPFDPREHEAVIHEASSAPDGHVIAEVQRGYRIRDRVLRPSLVKVSKNPANAPTQPSSNTTTQDGPGPAAPHNPGGIH
jgi:molecular chaperone GrpE